MSGIKLSPPVILDSNTNRAIKEIYSTLNKLLLSLDEDSYTYKNNVLNGSVRAVYDANIRQYKIQGKTSHGWASIAAQPDGNTNNSRLFDIREDGTSIFKNTMSILGISSPSATTIGELQLSSNKIEVTQSDLNIDVAGDITLDADGAQVYFKDNGVLSATINTTNGKITQYGTAGSTSDYGEISTSTNGAMTLTTVDAGGTEADLTFQADGDIKLNSAVNHKTEITSSCKLISTGTNIGLSLDYDHTGISASGQIVSNKAFDIALNSDSPTHVGLVVNYGLYNTITGGTSGTQTNYGLFQTVTGADTNVGIASIVDDGGFDLMCFSSADNGDYFSIATTTHGATTLATVDDDAAQASLTLDADGIINIDANANKGIVFKKDGAEFARLNGASSTSRFTIFENIGASEDDYFRIDVEAAGVTTISTVDAAASAANLTLDIDGDITLDAGTAAGRIFFKNAGDDFARISAKSNLSTLTLYEAAGASTSDWFKIITDTSGETKITTQDDAGAAAHLNIEPDGHVEFDGCGVGFDLVTPTYDATDTNVDFRTGNKQFVTFGSGNITDLNLILPATSGNFVVLLKQDGTGSRTVTNYKAGLAGGTSAAVKFPGGSNPTLTTDANHVDIISFFWDADNEICYGVATLDFQF